MGGLNVQEVPVGSKKQKNRAMEVLDIKDQLSTKTKQAEKGASGKEKTKAQGEKNGKRKVTEIRPGKVGTAKGGKEGRRGRAGGN